ncbi:MAG: 3-deoxy-manno-octulosonate cytidylyltransferase, partial [Gemmatimonadaceae bacterium]|nr:3-deoxy-manno-octulosonate cytidylyltransferase [Gemmatimonadaceae bacterium]
MSVLAVIPARLGATRLPRKPLRLLGGLPLVVRVWQHVIDMAVADAVVVATDAADIVDAVIAAGGDVVLTSEHHPSGTDRIAEVARRPEYTKFSVIVNVQGDEPFVPVAAVRGALEMVTVAHFPLGTAAAHASPAILAEPNVVKVVCGEGGRALYFSRAPIPFLRERSETDERDALVRQHLGIYAYTRQALANSPYHDDLLAQAKAPATGAATVVPRGVGAGSPIEHVIYIIRENRTYDQVFGDIKKGNGDPRLTIFGA